MRTRGHNQVGILSYSWKLLTREKHKLRTFVFKVLIFKWKMNLTLFLLLLYYFSCVILSYVATAEYHCPNECKCQAFNALWLVFLAPLNWQMQIGHQLMKSFHSSMFQRQCHSERPHFCKEPLRLTRRWWQHVSKLCEVLANRHMQVTTGMQSRIITTCDNKEIVFYQFCVHHCFKFQLKSRLLLLLHARILPNQWNGTEKKEVGVAVTCQVGLFHWEVLKGVTEYKSISEVELSVTTAPGSHTFTHSFTDHLRWVYKHFTYIGHFSSFTHWLLSCLGF